ncbi:MAG: response regulator [Thermodesulfobacteriota bacterium]
MAIDKKRYKILIVDDNQFDADLLEAVLLQLGFQNIIKTQSGIAALQLIQTHLPDLFFIDIMMPEMSGDQFRGLLKETPATRDVPVIFISGIFSQEEEKAISGRLPNGDLIVAKPFSKEKIANALLECLGKAFEQ